MADPSTKLAAATSGSLPVRFGSAFHEVDGVSDMPDIDRREFAAALLAGAVAVPAVVSRAEAAAPPANFDQLLVSVTDPRFGAKGDGKTDDTAAI